MDPTITVRYARDVEADKFDYRCRSFPRRRLSYGWKVQRRVSGSFFSIALPSPISGVRSHSILVSLFFVPLVDIAMQPIPHSNHFFFFPLSTDAHVISGIGPSFPFILPVYLSSWRMAVSPSGGGSSESYREEPYGPAYRGTSRSGAREDPPLDPRPSFLPRTQNSSLPGGEE